MALKHAFTSAAGASGDATQVDGPKWNDGHVFDSDGADFPTRTTPPSTPASGKATLYARKIGGRGMLGGVGESGVASAFQPFFARNKISMLTYAGNSGLAAAIQSFGMAVPSTFGSSTARNVASTNLLKSMRRNGYVSAATTDSRCGFYGLPQYLRGSMAQVGGFHAVFRFGCSDAATVAQARTIVGMTSTSSDITSQPSVATNCVFMGTTGGDANFAIYHNDGSGTCTKIDLGSDFPDHTLSEDVYEFALFCAPNGSQIEYEVTRLNRPDIVPATGVITSNLPVNTTLLLPQVHRTNGSTALAVGIDIVGFYIETDY
jgi:hypothetical protein